MLSAQLISGAKTLPQSHAGYVLPAEVRVWSAMDLPASKTASHGGETR